MAFFHSHTYRLSLWHCRYNHCWLTSSIILSGIYSSFVCPYHSRLGLPMSILWRVRQWSGLIFTQGSQCQGFVTSLMKAFSVMRIIHLLLQGLSCPITVCCIRSVGEHWIIHAVANECISYYFKHHFTLFKINVIFTHRFNFFSDSGFLFLKYFLFHPLSSFKLSCEKACTYI